MVPEIRPALLRAISEKSCPDFPNTLWRGEGGAFAARMSKEERFLFPLKKNASKGYATIQSTRMDQES